MVATVKEKNNSNLYCAYFLDNYESGEHFIAAPSHLTIIPPFVADNRNDILSLVENITSNNDSFRLEIGDRDVFGTNKDIPVFLIKPNNILNMIHKKILLGMQESRVSIPDSQYIGCNYRPHITIGDCTDLASGDLINFDHISIVEKNESIKTVLARFSMRGKL
jgi:2'-5' RNA ligase